MGIDRLPGWCGRGCEVGRLVLVEPVDLHRRTLHQLLSASLREGRCEAGYLADNDAVDGAVAHWHQRDGSRPPTNRRVDQLVLGAALRCGSLGHLLVCAEIERLRPIVVYADQSAYSRRIDVAPAPGHWGDHVSELAVAGHHAFWHSLRAVTEMTRRLAPLLEPARAGRGIGDRTVVTPTGVDNSP